MEKKARERRVANLKSDISSMAYGRVLGLLELEPDKRRFFAFIFCSFSCSSITWRINAREPFWYSSRRFVPRLPCTMSRKSSCVIMDFFFKIAFNFACAVDFIFRDFSVFFWKPLQIIILFLLKKQRMRNMLPLAWTLIS
jgi:hypothetical protein